MLKTTDFNVPAEHPGDMLAGYEHAFEKKYVLVFILKKCIENGTFEMSIETKHSHPTMVTDGLLKKFAVLGRSGNYYHLTKKSLGLLYSVYGKE
jgi:hypothetical protein